MKIYTAKINGLGSSCYCTGACRSTDGVNRCPVFGLTRQPQNQPFSVVPSIEQPLIMQGWQCPECRAINAPFVLQCPCSIPVSEIKTKSGDTTN